MTTAHPHFEARRAAVDTVTILFTEPGKLATKQFHRSSPRATPTKKDFDAGYLYTTFDAIGVNDIEELSTVLTFAESQPNALIVRGAPIAEAIIGQRVTRTGSGDSDSFVGNFKTPDAGRYYIEIDVDKFVLPKGWKLTRANIPKICEHIVRQLPPEFHEVSYHWQLSSSAGVFDKTTASIHLWFFLVNPIPDTELKRWAKSINDAAGYKLVDSALFQHVQAHYTAAPIFTGMEDPFPVRSGLTRKASDTVDLQLPKVTPLTKTTVSAIGRVPAGGGGRGFEFHLRQIGDHPGGDGFYGPLLRASASYVATHGRDFIDVDVLYCLLSQAVQSADHSNHSADEVKDRASREFIVPLIASAMVKFGDTPAQARKSRRIDDVPAHFNSCTSQSAADIQASMQALVLEHLQK